MRVILAFSEYGIIHGSNYNHYDDFVTMTNNYRLITAYLLLRVNLDKIMHAR